MTTEEISRDIYSPDGKRYGDQMTKAEKIAWAEHLNDRFMPEIRMILGLSDQASANASPLPRLPLKLLYRSRQRQW